MFKPNKKLKIISIIIIVLSIFNLVGVIFQTAVENFIIDILKQNSMEIVFYEQSDMLILSGIIGLVIYFFAGILGLCGKSYKAAFILMGTYIVLMLLSTYIGMYLDNFRLSTSDYISFMWDLLLPILYIWEVYQSY